MPKLPIWAIWAYGHMPKLTVNIGLMDVYKSLLYRLLVEETAVKFKFLHILTINTNTQLWLKWMVLLTCLENIGKGY